jgi:peroxiredoxin
MTDQPNRERRELQAPDTPNEHELREAAVEAAEHGRVGYGRYGRWSPLLLAILMILGLAVIGFLQWRDASTAPTPRPGQLPGSPAPDVSLTLLDGSTLDLADLRGSVVVLNFWASWCEPCRDEMPTLQALHDEALATGEATVVVGVGIRTDHDEDARAFVEQLRLTYPIGRDTNIEGPGIGPIEQAFAITGAYPSTIIIRPDGTVDRLLLGEHTASQIRFAIDEARAASATSMDASAGRA